MAIRELSIEETEEVAGGIGVKVLEILAGYALGKALDAIAEGSEGELGMISDVVAP